jgi:hypothetical protein
MNRATITSLWMSLALTVATHPSLQAQSLTLESQTTVTDGAEILSFSTDEDTIASTVSGAAGIGVRLYTLNTGATLTDRLLVDLSAEFGGAINSVSSVALDPMGRGFGVASVIPTDNGGTEGVVVFFNHRDGSEAKILSLTVGFHPDNVSFSHDGTKVFVANEGEFTTGGATDAPGSISVIDLSSVTTVADVADLVPGDVTTVDFSAGNLAAGVTLDVLRYNDNTVDAVANRFRHVEPEYITESGGKIYVSLQENNGIAELSLTGPDAFKYTAIHSLGFITQTIDASDRDGAGATTAALVDDVVKGMPMPDTISSFTKGGQRFIVTANEGDFRVDDDDRIRVKDFTGVESGVTMDRTDAVLGRLRVLKDVSDPDGDTLIDEAVMPGTRSFSIWNATTGALVGDTGSLEPLLLTLSPTLHNIDGESGTGTFDDRSDDKGPEPEALTTGTINGHNYVFVGMERQCGILMFNVDNPAAPVFKAYINNAEDGMIAPESITFLPATSSPSGNPTLLIGYEFGGMIGVYTVVGEPVAPAPKISVKSKLTVGPGTKTVNLAGRASGNPVKVTVNGKRAKGTSNWKSKLSFPTSRKTLPVKIVATGENGRTSNTKVKLKRKR